MIGNEEIPVDTSTTKLDKQSDQNIPIKSSQLTYSMVEYADSNTTTD